MNGAERLISSQKLAILSMDVEDWYHLDYFSRNDCHSSYSLLDGLERYLQIISSEGIPSSFFAVGDVLQQSAPLLRSALKAGHDVSSHGFGHQRPLTMKLADFRQDLDRAKKGMADALGIDPIGYRAPCFAMDRARLDAVREAGFLYDSSRIQFSRHPLYGTIDLSDFNQVRPWVYRQGDFFEFEVSTCRVLGRDFPVSGGGYIRLLPWWLMSRLIRGYLRQSSLYILYVHPFELSPKADPPLPATAKRSSRIRFSRGRSSVPNRLLALIRMLRENGFSFTTFARLRQDLLLPAPVVTSNGY